MRRAAKVDSNQPEIANEFRALGCTVAITSHLGKGFPDMVVGLMGRYNLLVEVKDGAKPPSARKLTPDEEKFKDGWNGQYCVVESIEDVHRLVNEVRKGARP